MSSKCYSDTLNAMVRKPFVEALATCREQAKLAAPDIKRQLAAAAQGKRREETFRVYSTGPTANLFAAMKAVIETAERDAHKELRTVFRLAVEVHCTIVHQNSFIACMLGRE